MQAECVLKQKQIIRVQEKQILKSLLTQEQIEDALNGKFSIISSSGQKLKLDDEVNETVLLLTPLCGG